MTRLALVFVAGLVALSAASCKDATLGPDLTGSIEGRVLDFESSAPLARASVTTSPPTGALVTDDQGAFTLADVPAGNYSITASLPGYATNAVTISVQENRNTQATIFLEQEEEDQDEASMAVEIVNWSNRAVGDSTFADVQYRVRNTGQRDIPAYEVYFNIATEASGVLHEERGTNLRVGQADVKTFEKYLASGAASGVEVENYWFEGQD